MRTVGTAAPSVIEQTYVGACTIMGNAFWETVDLFICNIRECVGKIR